MAATAQTRELRLDGRPLLTLVGSAATAVASPGSNEPLALSRFAWVRREEASALLETSLGPQHAVLHAPAAMSLVLSFVAARVVDQSLAENVGLPLDTTQKIADRLCELGLLVGETGTREEGEPPLAVWQFHDLLFHARSRVGRSRLRHGGTYRFLESLPPVPALPPPRWPEQIELPRPDYERMERVDGSLTAVQTARSSIRTYGERPITLEQLSEFLYRVGRVEDFWETAIPGPAGTLSFAARPYPSGGAAYELELYPAIRSCGGLEPGLYHYAAADHALARVGGPGEELDALFARSAAGMGVAATSLQVVVVITARFGRVAWKYESIAYELVLKHVGVLLGTMYLNATAMELAACAIGTGDSDRFALLSGIDFYEEPAVGELALGSHPNATSPAG